MKKNLNKHLDEIILKIKSIDLSKITVLTGSNGSGKSVIRKQISIRVMKELNLKTKSISMDTRTQSNPEFGAFSSIMHDTDWISTSQNTLNLLKGLFNDCKDGELGYVVLDEFEIGCSEETILALTQLINKLNLNVGLLIITHSRVAVNNLQFDEFINMENMSKNEWLNRKLIPTDLETLSKNELFQVIKNREQENKQKKENI